MGCRFLINQNCCARNRRLTVYYHKIHEDKLILDCVINLLIEDKNVLITVEIQKNLVSFYLNFANASFSISNYTIIFLQRS